MFLFNGPMPIGRVLLVAATFGAVFYVAVPLVLIFVLNVLLSAASVLDPLHAKQHVADLWTGFAVIAVFQVFITTIVCLGVLFASRMAVKRLSGARLYLAVAGASLAIHWFALAVFGIPTYLISRNELFSSFALLFWLGTVVSGPMLGVICAAVFNKQTVRME